jgi:hypothetical protein
MENKWYRIEGAFSRKFLVLAISTTLLWFGKVSDDVWLYVALAYIGTNVIQKYIEGRVSTSTKETLIRKTELSTRKKNNVGVAPGEEP